jgi:hypothetical protein
MYFPRNWEFSSALSKLRNNGGGGGLNPSDFRNPYSNFLEVSCEPYIITVNPNAVLCFPTIKNNNMAEAQSFEARVTLVPVYSYCSGVR